MTHHADEGVGMWGTQLRVRIMARAVDEGVIGGWAGIARCFVPQVKWGREFVFGVVRSGLRRPCCYGWPEKEDCKAVVSDQTQTFSVKEDCKAVVSDQTQTFSVELSWVGAAKLSCLPPSGGTPSNFHFRCRLPSWGLARTCI